jgi:WD40 repeat protein
MNLVRKTLPGKPGVQNLLACRLFGSFRFPKLAGRAMQGDSGTVQELCELFLSDTRHTEAAREALSRLPPHTRECLCDRLFLLENKPLQQLCKELGCLPGDPDRRAFFRAACGDLLTGPEIHDKEFLIKIAGGYLKASWAERLLAIRRLTASGRLHLLSEVLPESGEPGVMPAWALSLLIRRAAAHGDYEWIANRLFSLPLAAAHTAAHTLKDVGFFPADGDPGYWKALCASVPETFDYPSSSDPPIPAFSSAEVRFHRMSVNPAGTLLATGSYRGTIELWKLPGGGNLHTIRTGAGTILALAFSGDGAFIACGGAHGRILLIETRTGTVIRELSIGRECVRALCWLPNTAELVAGGSEGSLIVLSRKDDRVLCCRNSVPGITSLACARDGRIFSGHEDGSVRAWDPERETGFRFHPSHKGPVQTLSCRKDDSFLISYSSGDPIFLIRATDSAELSGSIGDETSLYTAMTIAPDGSWCAAGNSEGILVVWSLPDGKEIFRLFVHRNGIRALGSSPDGSMVIAGTSEGFIHVIPVQEPASARITKGERGAIHQLYATHEDILVSLTWQGVIEIRRISSGELLRRIGQAGGKVSCIGSADHAGLLAVATRGGLVRILDQKNPDHGGYIDAYVPSITAIALSRDGNTAVVAGNDSSLLVVRSADGSIRRQLRGHRGSIHALALHPAATLCAAAGWDTRVYLYQTSGNNCPTVLHGHRSNVTGLAFLHEGGMLASCSHDRTLRLWDLSDNSQKAVMEGHTGVVSTVAVSPDNRFIASGSRDRTIRLWSLPDATCCAVLEGHKDWVTSMSFCGEGILASGDKNGRIAFWALPDGELLRMEQSGAGFVSGISYIPDKRQVISTHQPGIGLIWNLPWTMAPQKITPEDLETIRGHLRLPLDYGNRQRSAWKFVEMLSIGHLRACIVSSPEPPLSQGYEIELAEGIE